MKSDAFWKFVLLATFSVSILNLFILSNFIEKLIDLLPLQ